MMKLLAPPETLKKLLSFAALLYVAGFLAVRSRLDFLGVYAALPFADQLYLEFGGRFLLATLHAIVPIAFLLLFVVGVGHVLARPGALRTFGASLDKVPPTAWHVVRFILVVSLYKLFQVQFEPFVNPGCILPEFCADGQRLSLPEVPDYTYTWLLVTTGGTGILAVLYRRSWRAIPAAPPWMAASLVFLFACQVVMLPMAYGLIVHSYSYPRVSVNLGDSSEPTPPQYLIFETSDAIILTDGSNEIVQIERGQLETLHVHCWADVLRRETCAHEPE